MRRSFGGLLLLVAAGLLAVGVGTFWLDRVAFSPASDTDATLAILGDQDIRDQVTQLVAAVDAPAIGLSPSELQPFLDTIATWRAGAAVMRGFVGDAHARMIGDHTELVTIDAATQVQMVRHEGVALQPPITLPVDEVGSLSLLNSLVGWTWIVALGLAVVVGVLGLFVRPEQGEFVFALAAGAMATGVSLVVFGWLVPAAGLGAVSDDLWTNAFGRLAADARTVTFVAAFVFIAVGAVVLFGTGVLKPRRSSSTPLAATRYRSEQRGWSR
ncbi:MAG: hypothetical protein AAGG08_04995 [Actinomycetota bacterium]